VAFSLGQPVSPIRFFTFSGRIPPSDVVFTASSSNPGWLPNASLNLSGSSSNRVLTVLPAPVTIGSTRITIGRSSIIGGNV
jgi:hypothetical protein